MIHWIKIRRVVRLCAVLALTLGGTALAGTASVPLPSLTSGALLGAPLALILPVVPVTFIVAALGDAPVPQERTATRAVRLLDLLLVAGAVAVTLVCSAAHPLGLAVARDLIGYLGAGLAGVVLLGGHAAQALPSGMVFGYCLVGLGAQAHAWWAWPFAPADAPVSWLCASSLLVAGWAAYARWGPRGG
ncbi:hypothetical protein LO762_13660 [Actinocorallia sp. API 0066]|uniref:hypothetical protein n=1 Tax=Actinocorallia sp. API 0066 TaxID=2896846 RepID=UPI001E543C2F|nr:hypothetical protein [Actinocorallia sp. API 0066]MCD0450231.1 hypothetical protein [Actinocorallia sp. API 0066]